MELIFGQGRTMGEKGTSHRLLTARHEADNCLEVRSH